MADYGANYPYGQSRYKDEPDMFFEFAAIEPIMLMTFEDRAYYWSHRSRHSGRREYRLGEFLKRGHYVDKFIIGA